jgi:hypothetical protein
MPEILFDALLHVHYGQATVVPEGSLGFGLKDAFRGQKNGLCGASVSECLFLITGLHTGNVQFRVELHEHEPTDLDDWDDVVEVPFSVSGPVNLEQWAGEAMYPLKLPEGRYRARYAGKNMDAGKSIDTAKKGPDSYLLQFWPIVTETPDAIIKQTSQFAQYWHDTVRKWDW